MPADLGARDDFIKQHTGAGTQIVINGSRVWGQGDGAKMLRGEGEEGQGRWQAAKVDGAEGLAQGSIAQIARQGSTEAQRGVRDIGRLHS